MFGRRQFTVGDRIVTTEFKERAYVFNPGSGKSILRNIYTDGPNHYIIWKSKLTKVEFKEASIVRYRLKGE